MDSFLIYISNYLLDLLKNISPWIAISIGVLAYLHALKSWEISCLRQTYDKKFSNKPNRDQLQNRSAIEFFARGLSHLSQKYAIKVLKGMIERYGESLWLDTQDEFIKMHKSIKKNRKSLRKNKFII